MAPISIKTVLISESVDPRCRAILEENGIRVTEKQNMKKDELIAELKVNVSSLFSCCIASFSCTSPPFSLLRNMHSWLVVKTIHSLPGFTAAAQVPGMAIQEEQALLRIFFSCT